MTQKSCHGYPLHRDGGVYLDVEAVKRPFVTLRVSLYSLPSNSYLNDNILRRSHE